MARCKRCRNLKEYGNCETCRAAEAAQIDDAVELYYRTIADFDDPTLAQRDRVIEMVAGDFGLDAGAFKSTLIAIAFDELDQKLGPMRSPEDLEIIRKGGG